MAVDLTDVSDAVVDDFVDAAENVFNNGVKVVFTNKSAAKLFCAIVVANAATYGAILGAKKLYARFGKKEEESSTLRAA